MTSPLFNIGGLASGLDTNAIVDQLMQLERNPMVMMNQRRLDAQRRVDAWSSVTTAVSSLRSAVKGLADRSDFASLVTATSSDPDAVDVKVTDGGSTAAMSFVVDRLATSHQLASGTSFSSTSDTVGAGTFTITLGGVDHEITTTAGTTVANLAADINSADVGVSASALAIDDQTVRLVLTAEDTGTAAAFTASGDQGSLATFDVIAHALDAQLTVGSGAGAIAVSRHSNTVDDLVDGVEIVLRQPTTSPVRVDVDRDLDGTVEAVSEMVDAVNRVMSTIRKVSRFDAEGDADGPLIGDSALRNLESGLVTEMTSVVESLTGDLSYASSIGLEYTIEREFTLDTERLRAALAADGDAVVDFFTRSGRSADPRVGFRFASDATEPGAYDVVVTRAATQASKVGALYVPPALETTFSLANGSTDIDITIDAGDSLEGAVARVNGALDAAGLGFLRATSAVGAIGITSLRHGSGGTFTITGSGSLGLDGTAAGLDVEGTIDGVAAQGSGRTLTSEAGPSAGLAMSITLTPGEVAAAGGSVALGSLSYSRGLMGELSGLLGRWEGADGLLARASAEHEDRVDTISEQIERFTDRLGIRERTLRRQFTAMESMMAELQGQSSYLASAMAGLSAPRA